MTVQRAVAPVTSSATIFFSALARLSTSRSCPHAGAARTLSSTAYRFQSSKRDLYTTPVYRPHSFPESFPTPPRNSGVPDTSIAGPKLEQITSSRPPPPPPTTSGEQRELPADLRGSDEVASIISLPEGEAQKSEPVTTPPKPAATVTPTESKPRRSKLKPRKAAMTITPTAITHLRELLSQPSPKMIRVGVKNRGCSGLAYHLEYVDKPGAFDEVVEQEGVKVLVDSKALFSIIGSEMDWLEDKLSTRFVFKNPNIKEQCGCGESFAV